MKKELPIAAGLLALGIALCWNVSSPAQGQGSAVSALESSSQLLAESATNISAEPATSFLEILKGAGGKEDLWCKSRLVSTGQAINRLPSIAVRTQLESRVHDITMQAQGKYFQAENGRKSRLELMFDDSQAPLSVLQICDGQFSHTLRSSEKQQRLEFVDLGRLDNKDAGLSSLAMPTSWVMGGGLGATLIHYAEAFHFKAIDSADPEKLHLRGVWDARVLIGLLYSDLPPEERPAEVEWDKLPLHMPHAIELTFSKRDGEVIQPETIAMLRFTAGQGRAVATPMITVGFDKFVVSQALPPALFTIESSGFEAVEMTDIYNQKILELTVGLPKVAAKPAVDQYAR